MPRTGERQLSPPCVDQHHPGHARADGAEFGHWCVVVYAYRHSYAQRHAYAGVPIDVLRQLMDHSKLDSTKMDYHVGGARRREAVDRVAVMQFNRHSRSGARPRSLRLRTHLPARRGSRRPVRAPNRPTSKPTAAPAPTGSGAPAATTSVYVPRVVQGRVVDLGSLCGGRVAVVLGRWWQCASTGRRSPLRCERGSCGPVGR
ncbi:MAG: hypothetical protein QOE61_4992 [Micromonosporaceae bacterium]|nr:hypothetical protein [Micromonosporaceae bacterium]